MAANREIVPGDVVSGIRSHVVFVFFLVLLGVIGMPRASRAQNPNSGSTLSKLPDSSGKNFGAAKLQQSVAVVDFNGDGITDVALADFLANKILVMLGDGQGHFRTAAKVTSRGGPRSIVTGDFNHDGIADLAVANFFSGDITIFIGRGDGNFEDPRPIHLAKGLSSLVVVDSVSVDNQDLVVANFLSGAITVLQGAPDGSFTVKGSIGSMPAVSLLSLRGSRGEGRPDFIAVDASGRHSWLFAGDGHGAFQPGKPIDPQEAVTLLRTTPRSDSTASALHQQPTISKAAGDGQLSYPKSELPEALVAVVTGPLGGVASEEPVSFSSLYGRGLVITQAPASPDGQGKVSAKVALHALPGLNFVAATTAGGEAVVFGAASVMPPADFLKQVETALNPASLGTADNPPLRNLLSRARSQLKTNDVVGAVMTLEACLRLLAPAESQQGVTPANSSAIGLLKRLLNQVILFGSTLPNISGTISCGQTVSGTLTAGQQDTYSFSANAGEVITWASMLTSGNGSFFHVCADLYDASSTKIAGGPCNGGSAPFAISITGSYSLVVHDDNYTDAGNYNLGLQFPTGRCAVGTGCGQIKTGSLVAAQQDVYSFSANAGEVITFPSMLTSGNGTFFHVCTDLYNASGTKIASNPCNGSNAPFTIPTTGTYNFVVHDDNYIDAGNYNLGLQFPTGRCAVGTGCGQIKTGSLVAAQQDVYSFSANAGEVITFPSMLTSGNGTFFHVCADLYNASGTKIASNPCNGSNAPLTIPTTGTYNFVVHDDNYIDAGNYNLGLQFPTGRCAVGTGCGQIKTGSLVAAQQDVYSFSANAGEVITFPSMLTSGNGIFFHVCADLYNASGTKIASNPCNGSNAPFTIPTTGTYNFVVHDDNYIDTGNYNLGLQFPTGRCAVGTGCGQIKTGSLVAAQQDVYSFSANAGEVITFPSMLTSGNGTFFHVCADLYNASGTKIASNPCNGSNAPFTIPTTGTYNFVVHDDNYIDAGTYNLGLQFPTGRCAVGTGCGQIKTGSLVAAQQDVYSFSANAGEVITFPSMLTSGNGTFFHVCADLYNASGTKIASNPCNGSNAPFTIPTTGTYNFVVHDDNYIDTGNYNLGLQFPTGRCAVIAGCGEIKTGALVAAQQDAYKFRANAGEVITWTSVLTSGNGTFFHVCTDLYNASGTKIASNPCNGTSAPFTIPTTGGYNLVVHDDNYIDTGTYKANWQFTTGCPACSLSPTKLTFPTRLIGTTSVQKNSTLTNTGTATMNISSIGLSGANPGDFTESTTCGTSLAVGASCTISATFKPTVRGARTAMVLIADNAPPPSPQVLSLAGTGTVVKLVPTSLAFGNQTVGTTSASKKVNMTNVGASSITLSAISLTGTDPGDFSETHTCGATLAAGASCEISVTFHPSATGARTASVSISDNGGGSPQNVLLSGTGT